MNKIIIDLKKYSTKPLLLSFLMTQIEGMFAPNYDALIDALAFYDTPLEMELKYLNSYENKKELLEVLDIIKKENKFIQIK